MTLSILALFRKILYEVIFSRMVLSISKMAPSIVALSKIIPSIIKLEKNDSQDSEVIQNATEQKSMKGARSSIMKFRPMS